MQIEAVLVGVNVLRLDADSMSNCINVDAFNVCVPELALKRQLSPRAVRLCLSNCQGFACADTELFQGLYSESYHAYDTRTREFYARRS